MKFSGNNIMKGQANNVDLLRDIKLNVVNVGGIVLLKLYLVGWWRS